MCQCCGRAAAKVTRSHKALHVNHVFSCCVNCSLLNTEEFWQKFLSAFIERQLNTSSYTD